jgi:SPP1 family predicted phage head-tail adaptor
MDAKPYIGHGAGEYNNRVAIEINNGTADASGQKKANWNTFVYRWAKIVPRTGRESWQFKQIRSEIDYLVYLRNDSDTRTLRASMHRINFGGLFLNIEAIYDVDTRRVEFVLHCLNPPP